MKILFTHRYFWPDSPPYAAMLIELARAFAAAGHDVRVFAGMPSYRQGDANPVAAAETLDGIAVRRCRVLAGEKRHIVLRLLNVLLYCGGLFWHILRTRPDVVTASTFPPVIAGWTASLAARLAGARFVYHMQDVHPEVSAYSGGGMGRGLAYRLFRALDSQTMKRASAIVVLSDDMANTVRARGLKIVPVTVINNFSLTARNQAEQAPPPELVKPQGRRRAIFAGNLGRFQNLPALAEGIALLFADHPDLELLFLGDGEALDGLKARWGDHPQVRFGPFLPFAQAKVLIRDADAGLVSLAPDIYNVSFPSKVQTYVELGLPILALVEPHSALAREITTRGLGEVPASSAPQDIAAALSRLLTTPDRAEALRAYTAETATLEAAFARWQTCLHALPARR